MSIIGTNRQRDLFLTDEKNVWFIAKGAYDKWASSHQDEWFSGEIECVAPKSDTSNSEVELDFVPVEKLNCLREIEESEVRAIHPKLLEWLQFNP